MVALSAFGKAAEQIRDEGSFEALDVRVPLKDWLSP